MKLRVKEKQENKLNTKKIKIGVLGGSFDPAHKGHLAISKEAKKRFQLQNIIWACLLYTSPSPRDATLSRMPSSA